MTRGEVIRKRAEPIAPNGAGDAVSAPRRRLLEAAVDYDHEGVPPIWRRARRQKRVARSARARSSRSKGGI